MINVQYPTRVHITYPYPNVSCTYAKISLPQLPPKPKNTPYFPYHLTIPAPGRGPPGRGPPGRGPPGRGPPGPGLGPPGPGPPGPGPPGPGLGAGLGPNTGLIPGGPVPSPGLNIGPCGPRPGLTF
eukprot:1393157-Amorphochlora_amoeboformis.AAC.1